MARLDYDEIADFVAESNRIEGIHATTRKHVKAHFDFLDRPLSVASISELLHHLQPDAILRNQPHIPGVQVGKHIAPPSGPDIETRLRDILAMRNPWEQHCAYEILHPFTDGNGRSGRAIWLRRHYLEHDLDAYAIRRGFLHSWYYQTLSQQRLS